MALQRIFDGTEAAGGYARAVRAENFLFIAGTTSLDKTGYSVESTVGAQTTIIYQKIQDVCERAGTNLANIVRIVVYLSNIADSGEFLRVHQEFFRDDVPAVTLIGGAVLLKPELRVEIEATAIVGSEPN